MSAHVLLNLLNELGKRDKMRGLPRFGSQTYRGSYMSAHVLVNLLKSLLKRDNMLGKPSILSRFRNEFNKFNNIGA